MLSEATGWWEVADPETVWRVCHKNRKADGLACEHCPSSEQKGDGSYTRGCYLGAVETVNIVQTGNPWRKTSGVGPPWVVLDAARAESTSELLEALIDARRRLMASGDLFGANEVTSAISRAEGLALSGGLKEGIAVSQSKPVFASNGDPQTRLSDGKGEG